MRMDAVVGGGERRAFDAVLEFLHVARPVVAHEHVDGGRGKAHHVAPVLEVHLRDEMFRQKQYVALALRQVGERNLHDVQAVEQVFAEELLLHHLFEIFARGRDEAHVGMELHVSAQAVEGLPLHKAQEFFLVGEAERRDVVQEERPAVCEFRLADVPGIRAEERSAFVTEEFALEGACRVPETFAQVRAPENGKRPSLARGEFRDGAGGEFLAGAVVAVDERGCVVAGAGLDLLVNRAHLAAVPDHLAGLLVDDVAQFANLAFVPLDLCL